MAPDNAQILKIGGYCGIAAVAAFVLGTLVSVLNYPGFSLSEVWTSDLGNYGRNLQGAMLYNAGGAIAGVLLVPFALSIRRWYDLAKGQKFFYDVAMHFGMLVSLGIFMQAVFPRGTDLHTSWSTVALFAMAFVLLFANVALSGNRMFFRPIGYFGFTSLLALLAFFVLYALDRSPVVVEWIAVFSYFLWALLLSVNSIKAGAVRYDQQSAYMAAGNNSG